MSYIDEGQEDAYGNDNKNEDAIISLEDVQKRKNRKTEDMPLQSSLDNFIQPSIIIDRTKTKITEIHLQKQFL